MESIGTNSEIIKKTVGLNAEPVGVKFLESVPSGIPRAEDHRFCQLVMRARKGESHFFTSEDITCPAAAAALGFKPLPPKLKDGSMLCGYGIFKDADSAVKVMEEMPRIEQGKYKAVMAKPLKDFEETPDVVVFEDSAENLMWIALAYLNDNGGRLEFSTSILQAVCVDSVVLPHLKQDINMSLGCYGCRDATDAAPHEALLGFPGSKLNMVAENLKHLDKQAIHHSRAKNVYNSFSKRINNKIQ